MGTRAQRSKITYNNMAAEYDTSPEGKYTRPHKAELFEHVSLRQGNAVLDVACGNGFLLGKLSKKAKIHAYGIDISENMIAAAKARYPHCSFAVSPCVPLPFEAESMDAITVSCAFHHFENPQAFASECLRVLKKNGLVYLAEPFYPPLIRWIANKIVFPFSKSGDVKVYSLKELKRLFEAAGFRTEKYFVKDTVLFFSAKKKACNSSF